MSTFAGRNWFYDFVTLPSIFDGPNSKKVADRLIERYSVLTKLWDVSKNTQWTLRIYTAAKLIMSATLHVNSADYAQRHNLRAVVPYLKYYSLLSLLRAICLTLPEQLWHEGRIIQMSHGAAIDGALGHIEKFNKQYAAIARDDIKQYKANRELLSYRAPSVGDSQIEDNAPFLCLCAALGEIAQFNSELLDLSITKNGDLSTFILDKAIFKEIAGVEIDGHFYGDSEDAYRLDYLYRKHPRPSHILNLMSEGHVEEFFGAWCSQDDEAESFNPDDAKQIIFEIP